VGGAFLIDPSLALHLNAQFLQPHIELTSRALLLEEVVDLEGVREADTAGDDEGDPSPAIGNDEGQLVLQGPSYKGFTMRYNIASSSAGWSAGRGPAL
jgi:hypothetical protein